MTRHDALIRVIDALHAEIDALKSNDIAGLERATATKLAHVEAVAAAPDGPMTADLRALADEAHSLNETARIYCNLMSANVRRRLQQITGDGPGAYRPGRAATACA